MFLVLSFGTPKKNTPSSQPTPKTISESEKKFYRPDAYYTEKVFEGTAFEKRVISFDERKRISYPSKNGLYVAEILLLEYCSYGTYPHPKNGYPGFWWFEYGIRDVGAALKSLEDRGFIRYATASESLPKLTVAQLKDLLDKCSLPSSGKKAELIACVQNGIQEETLTRFITERKYALTEYGTAELAENQYIPYMHKHPKKTTDDPRFGPVFNVWEINRILKGETSGWMQVVSAREFELNVNR